MLINAATTTPRCRGSSTLSTGLLSVHICISETSKRSLSAIDEDHIRYCRFQRWSIAAAAAAVATHGGGCGDGANQRRTDCCG